MFFHINDLSMYYEKYGSKGNVVLILPGWGETRETFRYMIDYLKKDFIVYIVDYPGFGNSPFPNRDLTIYDYTNLILDFLENENIQNPIVIAHSFGGRIAITLNGYYQRDLEKLILIGSAGIKPKKTLRQKLKQAIYKLLKKIRYILPKNQRKQYLNRLVKLFGSKDFQELNSNQRNTFIKIVNEDLSSYLAHIKAPTLLLWGEKDGATPLKDGKKMEKEIKDSGLVVFPNCGHFCYLEEMLLTNQIIEKFIKG